MNAALSDLSHQLLGALCNGVWQGLFLTAVVWGGLKVFRGLNAASRYAVELATLAIVAALPLVHFLIAELAGRTTPPSAHLWPTASGSGSPRDPSAGSALAPGRTVTGKAFGSSTAERPTARPSYRSERNAIRAVAKAKGKTDSSDQPPLALDPLQLRTAGSAPLPTEPAVDDIPRPETAFVPDHDKTGASANRSDAPASVSLPGATAPDEPRSVALPPAQLADLRPWRLSLPPGVSFVLVSCWGTIAGLRLAFLLWQYLALLRLKRRSPHAPESAAPLFDRLRRQMHVRRVAVLRVNDDLSSPVAAGFRSPAILLPTPLADEPAGTLESILHHELAHLERWDDWTNLIQQLVKATLFFHPSVLWLSRRLTIDREIACDDHVLAATRSPRDYALFLTEFASRARGRRLVAAPAAWSNQSQLKERIRMLLDSKRNTSPQLVRAKVGTLSTAAALLAALGLYAGPRLAFAQAEAPPAPGQPASNSPGAFPAREVSADRTNSAQPVPPTPQSEPSTNPLAPGVNAVQPPTARIEAASGAALGSTTLSVNAAPAAATPSASISFASATVAEGAPPAGEPALPKPADAALPAATPMAISAPAAPDAPGFQSPPRDRSEALEQRLDRVERMLELLLAQQEKVSAAGEREPIRPSPGYFSKSEGVSEPKVQAGTWYDTRYRRAQADNERRVQQTRERADRDARKAADVVEKARQEAELRVTVDAAQAQRRALEEQRRALQERIADIETQLNRLEQQLDRVNQQFEHLQEMKPRPEAQNQPAATTPGVPYPQPESR